MMTWTRRHTLIAGFAVILLTNAVALGGAWWNRSGNPDSTLKLTQRELQHPYWRDIAGESSGIMLNLICRTLAAETNRIPEAPVMTDGTPPWLDRAKMAELGFDVEAIEKVGSRRAQLHFSKEVLLVLELDGPTHRQAVERFRRHLMDEEAKAAAAPGNADVAREVNSARDWLRNEELATSRLFIIDAGLDQAALRARYPDRAQYAIVRGRVSPWRYGADKNAVATGSVQSVAVDAINVPHAFRSRFETPNSGTTKRPYGSMAPFEATVAFGQRLEPWIVSVDAALP